MNKDTQNVVLLIVDGFGIAADTPGNAVTNAKSSMWDKLRQKYPHIAIDASGNSVGLPAGYMGNSEVGHLTMGSGRITYQSLELINRSCDDNSIADKSVIHGIREHLLKTGGSLHLMGLISDGGVHSHQNHLFKLLEIFSNDSFSVAVHAFTDGRDTPPQSGLGYIQNLIIELDKISNANLASVIGRYYVMDRDKKWERTKVAYDMLRYMKNPVDDVISTIKERYSKNENDEFFKPIVVDSSAAISDGDAVLFFNFRPDRARQITMALNNMWNIEKTGPDNLYYATMTKYNDEWDFPIMFHTAKLKNTLAEIISNNGLSQTHTSETEKYAHVTFFFNGGIEKAFPNEERILVPSLNIATYDLQPSMSTIEIAEKAVDAINRRQNLVVLNIAAPDMVGHTGVLDATVTSVEVMDNAFKMIYDACMKNNYILCITSDHGNCEKMLDGDKPHTAHTTNLVPFLVTADIKLKNKGGLQNVAPTILDLMNIDPPIEMTGESLIIH